MAVEVSHHHWTLVILLSLVLEHGGCDRKKFRVGASDVTTKKSMAAVGGAQLAQVPNSRCLRIMTTWRQLVLV